LVVYYGLKNDGCQVLAAKLRGKTFRIPVGISVAKTNSPDTVDLERGIADYVKVVREFNGIGHYLTVNISCPNAFGGEPFTAPDRLEALLAAVDATEPDKPVFLKMPVDMTPDEMAALVQVADRHRVDGFILSNLTKKRGLQTIDPAEISGIDVGGISGRPVFDPSNELISALYRMVGRRYVIIGTGGIFSAEDAYEKIRRGASLVQLITGMIYEGPQLIGEINRGLAELLRRDGFETISQAVGSGEKG
jgi:dihydroorotate dehydrogenase